MHLSGFDSRLLAYIDMLPVDVAGAVDAVDAVGAAAVAEMFHL